MSFPEIRLMSHDPEIEFSGNIGWVFQDLPIRGKPCQNNVRNSWRFTWIMDQVDFIEYILQSSINMTLPVYYMYLQSRGTKYFHTCTLNAT